MFYAIGLDEEKSSPITTRTLDISYSMNTPGSSFSGATTASTCSSSKHSSATLSSDRNPAVNAQSVQKSSLQENSQGEDQITSQVEKGNTTGKTGTNNTRGKGKKNQ